MESKFSLFWKTELLPIIVDSVPLGVNTTDFSNGFNLEAQVLSKDICSVVTESIIHAQDLIKVGSLMDVRLRWYVRK